MRPCMLLKLHDPRRSHVAPGNRSIYHDAIGFATEVQSRYSAESWHGHTWKADLIGSSPLELYRTRETT